LRADLQSRPHRHGKTRAILALKKKVVKSVTSSPEEEFMFGFGMPELIIIMVIFLIIFGAGKLPEIGAGMGKAIKNFKNATSEIEHK
jgi:sec-independent protein translocase protein TatA